MNIRVGHGYDAHRLKEGRRLVIGGVEIPWQKGLDGHSDADVLIHSVIDAFLGALAIGDIGELFPDTDSTYQDADSNELLRCVWNRVSDIGWQLGNLDVTVIAQEPKLKSYIGAMRRNISQTCDAQIDDISIKATTEERMGFTGHGEGIASHAVCLLYRADPLTQDAAVL